MHLSPILGEEGRLPPILTPLFPLYLLLSSTTLFMFEKTAGFLCWLAAAGLQPFGVKSEGVANLADSGAACCWFTVLTLALVMNSFFAQ